MGPLPFLLLFAVVAPQDLEEFTECTDGYEWDPQSQHCKDIDECQGGSPPAPCRPPLRCLNHFGGYLCLPRSAALLSPDPDPPEGDPLEPLPFSPHFGGPPPAPLPPPESDGARSSPLQCQPGYGPGSTPGGGCQDIDECAGPPPCRPSQECINFPGGFECRCPPGYRHLRTECVDTDECRFRWCPQGCANSPGAFSCRCQPGFSLGPDGRSCLDVDECSMGARCAQRCLNTFGSFRCRCRSGFALAPDGSSCLDVDECSGGALCQHRCQNTPGSYSCLCPPGYGAQGPYCHDVDECSEGTHGCQGTQRCLNTFGGHHCLQEALCPPPYTPHPTRNGTCLCPGEVQGCAPLPRWFLLRFLPLPSLLRVPSPLFQLHLPLGTPPGTPSRLRLSGGPPGSFRLRELSNQSALLELTRPLVGPLHVQLEVELLPPGPHPPHPSPAPHNLTTPLELDLRAPPPGPALALLRLHLLVGAHPF